MRLLSAAVRLAVAVAFAAGLHVAGAHAAERSAALPEPFDASAIDRNADACTDFFAYATGAYRRAHPIPPAYAEYGYIEQLEDRTRDTVREILEQARHAAGTTGGNTQKIGTFYATCMDTAAIERHGIEPLRPELARIAAIDRRAQLVPEIAHLQAIGVDALFALNAAQDYHDSTRTIAEFDQGGLGLPERDYYVRTDADSRKLRRQYQTYVTELLRLGGDGEAGRSGRAVVAFETSLAHAAQSIADLREPEKTYHPMTLARVTRLAPHLALRAYLRASGIAESGAINVAEPRFLRAVDDELATAPLATWKAYLRWRLLDTYAPTLPARFDDAHFGFRERILNGAKAKLPRPKRCVVATDVALGEAVGEAYVTRAFPPAARARALALTVRMQDTYRQEMAELTWMTPATRRIAIAKLSAMGRKVGYPHKWRDYTAYSVRTDSFAANVTRGAAFARQVDLARIGRPLDTGLWLMTPQTVNAYNDTQRNEIVLPAAQLQRPFFDPAADDAANLGATGAGTIGHEMTHGFDDEGHKFDAAGNLRNWWTRRDLAQFTARAQCIIRQFDRTVAIGTIHYQGRLVSGEAIADLGGLVIGYRALKSTPVTASAVIDGYTAEQRYFLAFAQSWSESVRPEAARTQALGDPHPLPRDRVNATVANVPAWYAAFNCPKPARPICQIW